jgi:ADP-heptose:LPS heptosyltransferase
MHRLIILAHGGLGDVIMALPALWAADSALGAGTQIEVITKGPIEGDLLGYIPWRSSVTWTPVGAGSKTSRARSILTALLRMRRGKPSHFLPIHVHSRKAAQLFSLVCGASRSVLPAAANDDLERTGVGPLAGEHKVEYIARFFVRAGLIEPNQSLVFPPIACPGSVAPPDGLRIIIAPMVGSPIEQHKKWPFERFVALGAMINRRFPNASVELFGGPSEKPQLAALAESFATRPCVKTPPTPSAAVADLSGADVLVSACGGATHLAALAGVPVVGIYGPTNPGHTGPYTTQLYPVRLGLRCSPCYRMAFIQGCGTPICMSLLPEESVIDAVEAALSRRPPPPRLWLPTTNATAPVR